MDCKRWISCVVVRVFVSPCVVVRGFEERIFSKKKEFFLFGKYFSLSSQLNIGINERKQLFQLLPSYMPAVGLEPIRSSQTLHIYMLKSKSPCVDMRGFETAVGFVRGKVPHGY